MREREEVLRALWIGSRVWDRCLDEGREGDGEAARLLGREVFVEEREFAGFELRLEVVVRCPSSSF